MCSNMFCIYIKLPYIKVPLLSCILVIQHNLFDAHGFLQLILSTKPLPDVEGGDTLTPCYFQWGVREVWRSSFQQHGATEDIMQMVWMNSLVC